MTMDVFRAHAINRLGCLLLFFLCECATVRIANAAAQADSRTRTVTIVCVDESGNPVEGADVYIVDSFSGVKPVVETALGPVVTNADGVAKFPGLPTSDELEGSVEAYARVPGKLAGLGLNHTNLAGNERKPDQPVRVVMRRAQLLRGRLATPERVAPESVVVRVQMMSTMAADDFAEIQFDRGAKELWPELAERRLNADGSFELRDVPDNVGMMLYARGPGVATTWLRRKSQPANGLDFEDTLESEAVIEGTLVDTDGRPLAGEIRVQAVNETPPLDNRNSFPTYATPKADGQFRVSGLSQGVHTLSITALPDDRAAEPVQVRVERGQTLRDVKIAIERGVVVTGTVADAANGKPLSNAAVAVAPDAPWGGNAIASSALTGADGRFSVRAPSASVRVYVFQAPEGYSHGESVALDLRPGAPAPPEVQFKLGPWKPRPELVRMLAPKGGLRGRVVDAEGKPVANVIMQCGAIAPEFSPRMGIRTKDDGCFEFRDLEADVAHKITIPEWNTSPAESDEITVEANVTRDVPDLEVTPRQATGEVRGVVIDEQGAPIAKAWIRIDNIESSQTDAEGRFRLEVFDAAPQHSVGITAASYIAKAVHVEPGVEARIVLEPAQPGEGDR